MQTFPKDFFWGAATSAHQVEGNTHNNWSEWEQKNAKRLAREAHTKWQTWQQEKFPEMFTVSNYISGRSADHYHRYEQDFDLAQEGGHNAHRFSIEWARIEPEEGKFDAMAIQHYKDVVRAIRERGMEPFVTLWHWTNPLWLEERGGVLAKDFVQKFARYATIMADAFGDDVLYYITLNEPMSVIGSQYITGAWPHQSTGLRAVLRAYRHLSDAHVKAYTAIKAQHPHAYVGLSEIFTSYESTMRYSPVDWLMVQFLRYWSNKRLIIMTKGRYDFLGVQYYFHLRIGVFDKLRKQNVQTSDLGWELYAKGLYNVIMECAQYNVPLYITENGLADADDTKRSTFIKENLMYVERAIGDGADVRGYFHWSLMDNFEWDKGFWPRFGLIAIDFATLERKLRPSFWYYKDMIQKRQKESM